MANIQNLKPIQSENEAREKGRIGGIKSGIVRKEKKLLSLIYADYLSKQHKVNLEGKNQTLSGLQIINSVINNILIKGENCSVLMLKEMREATENKNSQHNNQFDRNIIVRFAEDKEALEDDYSFS